MNADELADPAVLEELLAKRSSRGRVSVGFASGSQVAMASAGDAHAAERWPIGCVTKLFTATLVRSAAARGAFELDGGVARLLGADSEALRGVTVRHLLEHTHGLDDSLLAHPRYVHGYIDGAELVQRVGALERFARPGGVYSYGHAGAWLAAALLERTEGRAFAALVCEQLLQPLGFDGIELRPDAAPLCAASGAKLELTAAELARFGLHALAHGRSLAQGRGLAGQPITPLPGWHPLERGVCLAWKYAGAGWFGHQSVWPRASSYLRVHPQRGLALAVQASEEPAALVALGLFGSGFPELFEWCAPRSDDERTSPAAGGAPGAYAQAARVVVIARAASGLRAETWPCDERGARLGAPACASLVPAGSVLFCRPAREHLPYVELVRGEDGAVWLWNGRCVLRRA